MSHWLRFLKEQWFLVGLTVLLIVGLCAGWSGHGPLVKPITAYFPPRLITGGVLFLMAFSLDTQKLRAAFLAPFPVALAFVINLGAIPLLAWGLMRGQLFDDFRIGLMIAASVPSTTAAASVMTRKAGGNDAVSLLVTLATNGSCVLLTPLWLYWATSTRVELDLGRMMLDLVQAVMLPSLAGQLLRQVSLFKTFATTYKQSISNAAQCLIELMVFTAALEAGIKMHAMSQGAAGSAATGVSASALLLVWFTCLGLHAAALWGGRFAARRAGVAEPDAKAVGFSASQKTLPIGLYLSTELYSAQYPFAMFPMLLYHATQLFLDTAIASRWSKPRDEAPRAK